MLHRRHLCTQLAFRTPRYTLFYMPFIVSFQTIIVFKRTETFFFQTFSTTFEMLKWELLKWVLEKILNNLHPHRYVTLKWIQSVSALQQLCLSLQPLVLIFATVWQCGYIAFSVNILSELDKGCRTFFHNKVVLWIELSKSNPHNTTLPWFCKMNKDTYFATLRAGLRHPSSLLIIPKINRNPLLTLAKRPDIE